MRQDLTLDKYTLSERELRVLNTIIESFVGTAVPVGSRIVAKKSNIKLSPASIRNVMGDLEELGYLTHPHTSAGRIPTDKGYRTYVDSLMDVEILSEQQRRAILDQFLAVSRGIDSLLVAASQVIARVSNQLGVVLSPRFFQGVFEKIDLVPISSGKVLMVLSIKSGLVRTIMLEVDSEISRDMLERTATVINERLQGLSLDELHKTIEGRLKDVAEADSSLLRTVLQAVIPSMESTGKRIFHFGGTKNIMAQPEFVDQEKLSNILNLLESKEILVRVFDSADAKGELCITIGEENQQEVIKYCSLITASYHLGNITGTLGVLGPTRMNYAKVVGLVDFMAKTLTQLFEERTGDAVLD